MSDGVTIAGGGTTAVDTPEMQRAGAELHAADASLAALLSRVSALRGERVAWVAALALDEAIAQLGRARDAAAATASGLALAAVRYGLVEQAATVALRDTAAVAAGAAGTLLGTQPIDAAVRVLEAESIDLLAIAVSDGGPDTLTPAQVAEQRRFDARWHPGVFDWRASTVVTTAIGLLVSSTDDFVRGERGEEDLPEALRADPADPLSTQAIARLGAARFHDLPGLAVRQEGGRLEEVPGRTTVAAPRDLAGLAELVPDDGDGRAQVRVEAVPGADGVRRWIVAVAGTTTFDPDDTDQVFDMRSNLQGVGGEPMDAEIATERALRDAGVAPGDPVLVVGHSQGALVATGLAASGRFDVAGVVTLGGPTRAVAVPASVPVLAVEHTDDYVPTLGGAAPTGAPAPNVVRITRTVYDTEPPPIVGHVAMDPAHQPAQYVRTLRLAEASSDPRVADFRARIQPFLGGGGADEGLYRADRVPDPVPVRPAVTPGPPAGRIAAAAAAPRPSR